MGLYLSRSFYSHRFKSRNITSDKLTDENKVGVETLLDLQVIIPLPIYFIQYRLREKRGTQGRRYFACIDYSGNHTT